MDSLLERIYNPLFVFGFRRHFSGWEPSAGGKGILGRYILFSLDLFDSGGPEGIGGPFEVTLYLELLQLGSGNIIIGPKFLLVEGLVRVDQMLDDLVPEF